LKPSASRILSLLFYILILYTIPGCTGKQEMASIPNSREDDPMMTANKIDVIFSDSGHLQARLISPLLKRYAGEKSYLEFPDGFKIYIYDSVKQVSSTITGNYGKRFELGRRMEAKGNVIVRNEEENKQLNTEYLVWDENKHTIWSNVRVKITTPDKVLYGDGMESNESFTRYTIKNPSGQMTVKKDSL